MICWPVPVVPEMSERQAGFMAPNLSPVSLRLIPRELATGVFALMANQLPKDNNGLIVGEKAALVVDSGITPGVGRYLQEVVRELTDVPVRYLANTTFHGDHTFGNVAFGDDVAVVSSRLNKASMTNLEEEKRYRSESMYGDPGMEEVVSWRRPEVVFDRFCEIDLGGRVVHLWHFGTGNGSGDTIVHVPDAKVAWRRLPPARRDASHAVGRGPDRIHAIDPGHEGHTRARPLRPWPRTFQRRGALRQLDARVPRGAATSVDHRRRQGMALEDLLDHLPLRNPLALPAGTPGADRFPALMQSLHRLNILLAYRYLEAVAPA